MTTAVLAARRQYAITVQLLHCGALQRARPQSCVRDRVVAVVLVIIAFLARWRLLYVASLLAIAADYFFTAGWLRVFHLSALLPLQARWLIVFALIVIVAGFELAMTWLLLHPAVPTIISAYYIDRPHLPQNRRPVATGNGVVLQNPPQVRSVRVCGWDGPVGDSTHSIGTRSMRASIDGSPGDLILNCR